MKATGKQFDGLEFRIQVSPLDCTGCDNCVDVCPGKKGEKALVMKPLASQEDQAVNFAYMVKDVKSKQKLVDIQSNVKNSQFATPLFEFSGACAGCGETPYIKLISQLFGDRQMIANATGCTSIYSGSAPSTPYTKNENGHGPAWANSLFEDNAEFGLGMSLAVEKMRARIERLMNEASAMECCTDELKAMFAEWIENQNNADATIELTARLIPALEACGCE
ncbi:MAG: pyruvate:ferredoxin (flavodoxin) oxidoreductase, partial [Oscillospiraceae bacterium]